MRRALLLIAHLVFVQPLSAQNLQFFSVGTGDPEGGYFAATRAICEVLNRAERGRLRCSPEATPGSLYNLVALDNGQLDFALVQSDLHRHAVNGTSIFAARKPMTRFRSVMSLYPEPFNLIARKEARIGSALDLVGKAVDMGPPYSGRQATMRAAMESFGIKVSDFRIVAELAGSDAISELCAGRIDATVLIVGHPSVAIARALDECNAELVSLPEAEIQRLVSRNDDYSRFSVPARTYPALRGEVSTFAVRATVLTVATMADDMVDALVRNTLVNLGVLQEKLPILAALEANAMRTVGLTAPLHPGAARAFDRFLARN
jgi:TRAP transporter TAXI family solute receptor